MYCVNVHTLIRHLCEFILIDPPPKEINSPNGEKKKSSSEPASKLLKLSTPLLDSLNQKSPTDSIPFNSNTIDGTKELSAGNKNVPTTSTRSSTITMDCNYYILFDIKSI